VRNSIVDVRCVDQKNANSSSRCRCSGLIAS
jgi:hypothetical protein